jgi:DNA-binding transcriptional LysR family regulator
MDLSHKHLRHVAALDRHRHYGRAAETLGISQPALSRSILAVEKRLGVVLFDRSHNRIEPTEAGRLVLRHARDVALLSSGLESELSNLHGIAQRRFSVVCGHYPAELTVPRALSTLMREWPDARFNMEVADWSRGIELLEKEICELAIIELSASSQQVELHRELLNDQQVFCMVRRSHPLANRSRPTLQDVLGWPWSCSQIPQRAAQQLGAGPHAAGDFDEQSGHFVPKIIASSLSTSLRLVMENDIVGIAPLTVAEPFLENGQLWLVPLNVPWMRLNYGFIWDASRAQSASVTRFMAKIREAEARERDRNKALRARYGVDDW